MTARLRSVLVAAVMVGQAGLPAAAGGLVIGTASPEGVYFAVGRAVCFLLERQDGDLACEAVPTDGSIANLDAVLDGTLPVALAQSDWQRQAFEGTGPFAARGPGEELRALFSVHGEPFTVVARVDSGIAALADLVGKRVNIGSPGSGQRATMERLMALLGWSTTDFALAEELPPAEQSFALCHGRIQALVYTVGHPNASINRVTGLCDARLVPVEAAAIDALVEESPDYAHMTIPGGIYANNPDPVATFGVRATLVASAETDAVLVYTLVRTVFDDLDTFRAMHPAFGLLTPEAMASEGLSAPLHDGAARYFREKGLLVDEEAEASRPAAEP